MWPTQFMSNALRRIWRGMHPPVMAGPCPRALSRGTVPAIGSSTLPVLMAGTIPGSRPGTWPGHDERLREQAAGVLRAPHLLDADRHRRIAVRDAVALDPAHHLREGAI